MCQPWLSAILGYPDQQPFDLVEGSSAPEQPAADVNTLIMEALRQRPKFWRYRIRRLQRKNSATRSTIYGGQQ